MKRLILHVGLPKTGTSALQAWCDLNRGALLDAGVFYPESDGSTVAPKHQFLIKSLFDGDMTDFSGYMKSCAVDSLLLSTEGLSNHLYDFPEANLARFRHVVQSAGYLVSVFIVSRDPQAWIRSYYKQAIINPPSRKFEYGGSKTLQEFSRSVRVKMLTDYSVLKRDLGKAFGGEVFMSEHGGDWFADFISVLGVAGFESSIRPPRVHESVSDDLIELIRQINAQQLSADRRETVFSAIHECCKTNHQNIAACKKRQPFSLSVFQRLAPQNHVQASIKESLIDWHKKNISSLLWFQRWV